MSEEIWKPVVGWEGLYEVSSHGRVRRVESQKVLKPWKQFGYERVTLSGNSRRKSEHVARLVLASFKGLATSEKPYALHGDGSRDNNHLNNLRWGSHSDNMLDAVKHGTHGKVKKTHCSKGHEYSDLNTSYRPDRPNARNCRTCQSISNQARYKKRSQTSPPNHGTVSGYLSHKCRCNECKIVHSEYQKNRRAEKSLHRN